MATALNIDKLAYNEEALPSFWAGGKKKESHSNFRSVQNWGGGGGGVTFIEAQYLVVFPHALLPAAHPPNKLQLPPPPSPPPPKLLSLVKIPKNWQANMLYYTCICGDITSPLNYILHYKNLIVTMKFTCNKRNVIGSNFPSNASECLWSKQTSFKYSLHNGPEKFQ